MSDPRVHWGTWDALADLHDTWDDLADLGLTWGEAGFVPTATMEQD